jgi:hypothetical protein
MEERRFQDIPHDEESRGVRGFFSRHLYSIGAASVVTGVYCATGRIVEAVVGFVVGIVLTDALTKILKL